MNSISTDIFSVKYQFAAKTDRQGNVDIYHGFFLSGCWLFVRDSVGYLPQRLVSLESLACHRTVGK